MVAWRFGVLGALLLASPAGWAGDLETFVGGNVITGAQYVQGPSGAEGTGVGTIQSQVEFDLRLATGPLFVRLDLDYHVDPWFFGKENADYTLVPGYPLPPEFAFVQLGHKYHVRMGVTSPNFGMQVWDEKDNYLPTFSSGWTVQNGQCLGLEAGMYLGDDTATEVFAFGGYDMAWFAPVFGAGVSSAQDMWGTWTGLFVLPTYPYAMFHTGNEVYPLDAMYVSTELNVGYADGDIIGGGQIVLDILPESVVGFDVRADKQFFTDKAATLLEVDVPSFALSGAVRVDPVDFFHVALEGKQTWPRGGGDPFFTGTLLLSAQVPGEPSSPYVVSEE